MKIQVYDILYVEKTREWNVTLNALTGYVDYINNDKADHSIWRFNDFMEMETETPTEFILDIADMTVETFDLNRIEEAMHQYIRQYTTRDIKDYKIRFLD